MLSTKDLEYLLQELESIRLNMFRGNIDMAIYRVESLIKNTKKELEIMDLREKMQDYVEDLAKDIKRLEEGSVNPIKNMIDLSDAQLMKDIRDDILEKLEK